MPLTANSVCAVAAALAFAGVVSATPLPELIESHLQARGLQSPVSGLPGCGTSDEGQPDNEDPTWAVGQSNYTDGEGYNVGNDCTTGHGSQHCWTDYFLVGTTETYNDWYNIASINCTDSSNCYINTAQLSQSCTTTTWSVSETISSEIDFEIAKIGFSISVTAGQSYQSCNGNTTTADCTWDDQQCHSAWAAARIATVLGYKRRSCVSPTNNPQANMPNQPKRSDGFYTRGMMDFAIPLANGNYVNCGGNCDATYTPGALPPIAGGGVMVPWGSS